MDLKHKICVHCILDGELYTKLHVSHAPLTGDELRFGGAGNEAYFTVGRRIWVYDEPEVPMSRLNVEITEVTDESN
jgi:thymidine kinase